MSAVVELSSVRRVHAMGHEAVPALRDVSLSVAREENVAVQGPSGCGKSTLLNVMGLLDRPTSGRLLFLGEPAHSLGPRELARLRNRHIGFVFQQFHLLPQLCALDNVALPLHYAPQGRRGALQAAAHALESVGLTARARHLPGQLSGGERQRVAIARALVVRPLLLLADEPTGALDSDNGTRVLDLLLQLHRQQRMALVVVTHDAGVAARLTRQIHMRDGAVRRDHVGPR